MQGNDPPRTQLTGKVHFYTYRPVVVPHRSRVFLELLGFLRGIVEI